MRFSEFFIERPIGTSLLAGALLLAGLVAWPLLPVAPLPQVDFPAISVSASLPGAAPEIMAANVASPLERQFAQIPGVEDMTSSSSLGSTSIALTFSLDRNIDAAAQDVQAAINAASRQLPTAMPAAPTLRKSNPADRPIITLLLRSDVLSITALSDLADTLVAPQISQIDGVGNVNVNGARKPAVRIQVAPGKLASVGLGLEDVRSAVANASVSAPKGSIDGPRQTFTVSTNDQVLDAEQWQNVVISYRKGAAVRVRDVGVAVADAEDVRSAAWAFNGAGAAEADRFTNGPGLVLTVSKQSGANVIETVERVKRELGRIRHDLPPAAEISVLQDRTQTIRASVHEVQFTLVLSVILVVAVIFLFLRNGPATLIAGSTIPLALFGTAAAMLVCGYSRDNLSLMALTIAVGFVVDDAIVMLENIYRHVENGVAPLKAAVDGAREVGFTVISISVSLVAVFIPVLFMGGVIGRLFREFAVTMTLAIAISVLVSLTLIPTLCARFLTHAGQAPVAHGRLFNAFERGFGALQDAYRRGLDWVLRHQRATLLVFFASLAASVALYVGVPKGFFPQQDTGVIFGTAEGGQDASFEGMRSRVQEAVAVLQADPDVDNVAVYFSGGNAMRLFIGLKPRAAGRTATPTEVITRLRPRIARVPGLNFYFQAAQDISIGSRGSRTQFQYTVSGTDLDELNRWAPLLLQKFRALPQLADVASDQQNGAAVAQLTIDRERASALGITPATIDATLYDAIGQRQVAQYYTQANSYKIILEVTPALQADTDLFSRLYVTSPLTGKAVPLATFVRVDTGRNGFLSIGHQARVPAVTLSFNLAPGVGLGEAVKAVEAAVAGSGLPATLNGSFQGAAQAFQSSLASQPLLIAAAVLAVYVVLGFLYESYLHPLTILSTLPSAGMGALLALWVCGFELDVIGLIGILLLIGIVKKNGIMMVDFALSAERERGATPEASIREACLLRFRPIMMTTLCAILSGLPLTIGSGAGAELRQPLGVALVGGLVVSQLLTLFTTPVVYLALDRVQRRWRNRRTTALPLVEGA